MDKEDMVRKNKKRYDIKQLRVEKISEFHKEKIDSFESSVVELSNFLKEDALNQQERKISVTYLWFLRKTNELIGYATLSPDCVKINNIRRNLAKKFRNKGIKYKSLPALKLGRLCVCDKYQGYNIGTFMIQFTIYKAKILSEDVGCRFLYLDAKRNEDPKKDPIHFYKKFGFEYYKKDNDKQKETPLYLDIFPISEALTD